MKKFLRENPTIAFGLGLPLLLVAIFLLISGIPTLFVTPPQYEVLYATQYYNYSNGVQIAVVGGKVQANYLGSTTGYQTPRLWRFNPKSGAVREVPIMLPPGLTPAGQAASAIAAPLKITPIATPDLDDLKVDSSNIAPDGYEFSAEADGDSGHVFSEMMFSPRYQYQATLIKNGRSVRLPNTNGSYYSNYTRFIGWIVSP